MNAHTVSSLVLIALFALACGGKQPVLSGAYGDVPFDRVVAYRDHTDLLIIYEADAADSIPNQVARLLIRTDRVGLKTDEEIFFVAPEISPPAGAIERYVTHRGQYGDAIQEPPLPAILRASVIFFAYGEEVGSALRGRFSCEFTDKKHLNGDFDTTLGKL